jgi:hypothetical protein
VVGSAAWAGAEIGNRVASPWRSDTLDWGPPRPKSGKTQGVNVEGAVFVILWGAGLLINLMLLLWFVTAINIIKARLHDVKSTLYDIYEEVFDLRETAKNIEKLLREERK